MDDYKNKTSSGATTFHENASDDGGSAPLVVCILFALLVLCSTKSEFLEILCMAKSGVNQVLPV